MRGDPTVHTWPGIKAVIPLTTPSLYHLGNITAGLLGCEGCRCASHIGVCCSEHVAGTCWEMLLCLSSTIPHYDAPQEAGENIGAGPGSRLQLSNPFPCSCHQSRTKEGQSTCSLLGRRDHCRGLWHPQLALGSWLKQRQFEVCAGQVCSLTGCVALEVWLGVERREVAESQSGCASLTTRVFPWLLHPHLH